MRMPGRHGMTTALVAGALLAFAAHADMDYQIDLSKIANMDFKDEAAGDGKGGWSDQGPDNDMQGFDFSRKDYEGVTFSVLDPAKNGGRAVLTFDSPHAKTGLVSARVDFSPAPKARFLYLLHTSCWNQGPAGTPIGAVEARFADGSKVRQEVRAGTDVADWWNASNGPNAQIVAKRTGNGGELGVFLSKFKLSDKDAQAKSIELKTSGKAVWIVLGATLSSKDVELKDKSLVFTTNGEWLPVDLDDVQVKAGSALDLSPFLEPGPAGSHGRAVVAKDGALAFEDSPDTPRRLFGFTGFFTTIDKFDTGVKEASHALIRNYAALCRRQGYDVVRPMALEYFLMGKAQADCQFNPARLDLVDKLIAELKAQGVYTCLTIAAERLGSKAYPTPSMRSSYKVKMYTGDKDVRARWKAVAETMLSHVNPYTGLAWKDDPAIAIVEFYNEQELGLLRLALYPENHKPANERWRAWLLEKYRSPAALALAWGKPSLAGKEAFAKLELPTLGGSRWEYSASSLGTKADNDFCLFVSALAREELAWCEGVVRNAGYKGLFSQFDCSKQTLDSSVRWEGSPVVAMHVYHSHPSALSNVGSKCGQASSAGQAAAYWREANATRLSGRPFFITEHNHAFWNKYQHEDGLLFAAYSALQGFSLVTSHEDAVSWDVKEPVADFSTARSPVSRANEFIAACLFRRGDVKKANGKVELQISPQYLNYGSNGYKAVNTEQSKIALMTEFSLSFPGLRKAPWIPEATFKPDIVIQPDSGAEVKSTDWTSSVSASGKSQFSLAAFSTELKSKGILPASNLSDPDNGVFQSETGEIMLRTKENLIKVITEKTEGVSLEAGKAETMANLTVLGSSVPAAIATCSIDGKPLASSSRIVLVYSTDVANSGMELSENRVTMRKVGTLPILMKTGKLSATLKNTSASKLSLYVLRIDGTRQEKLPLGVENGVLKINLDTRALKNGPTPFFELVAE